MGLILFFDGICKLNERFCLIREDVFIIICIGVVVYLLRVILRM